MLKKLVLILFFQSFISLSIFSEESQRPILITIGTRPEAIKMLPLYFEIKKRGLPVVLCSTGQHSDLLDDVFKTFDIEPDINLKIMKPSQDLFYLTSKILTEMKSVIEELDPCLVIVHGDTSTAVTTALAAFYSHIPIAHIEAGLRSGNILSPFPEEMNRQVISRLATYHFTPTENSKKNIIKENINSEHIYCTGNTGIDALFLIKKRLETKQLNPSSKTEKLIVFQKLKGKKIMLMTAHRRESFNGGLENIFTAIKKSLEEHPDLFVIYPMHPNPQIQKIFTHIGLDNHPNILVIPPVNYKDMVYLLTQCDLVATDSGGLQEEAISLQKPVIVLRNETDRPEGLERENYFLVGTDTKNIIFGVNTLINLLDKENKPLASYPYGKGYASEKIASIIQSIMKKTQIKNQL